METKPRQIKRQPARIIAAAMEALIPYPHREYVMGDLKESYVSSLRFMRDTLEWVIYIIRGQLPPSFNLRLLAAEAAAVTISFSGAPVSPPMLIALAAALAALVLRDAYIYPARGTPEDSAVDALIALTFVIMCQIALIFFAPGLALPAADLLRSGTLFVLTVSATRMLLRRAPGMPPSSARRQYRATQRMNAIWGVGAVFMLAANSSFVPEVVPHQDFLATFLPMAAFVLGAQYHRNRLGGTMIEDGMASIFQDPQRQELKRKRDRLLTAAEGNPARFRTHRGLEILTVVLCALPLLIALVSWLSGHKPSTPDDWFALGGSSAALVSLTVLWIHIKKANERAAQSLQDEIDGPADGEKK